MDPSGFGLALCLDDILGYDRDRFIKLENRFKKIFPQFKSIKLVPEPAFRSPADDSEEIPMLQNEWPLVGNREFTGQTRIFP